MSSIRFDMWQAIGRGVKFAAERSVSLVARYTRKLSAGAPIAALLALPLLASPAQAQILFSSTGATTAVPGETSTVTITFYSDFANTLSDVGFTLDLDAGLSGSAIVDASLSYSFGCETPDYGGSSFVTFQSIEVSTNFTACEIKFDITVPSDTALGTYTFSPSDLTGTGSSSGGFVHDLPNFDLEVAANTDTTAPNTSITGPSGVVSGDFNINVSWFEGAGASAVPDVISGFELTDLVVTNGTVAFTSGGESAPTGNNISSINLVVTPTGGTPVTVFLPADSVTDQGGNGNLASNTLSVNYDVAGDPADDVDFSMAFLSNPIDAGDTVAARFTITNNSSDALTVGTFDLDIDAAASAAFTGVPPITTPCGAASAATFLGSNRYVVFSNLELGAGASCTFDLSILADAALSAGTYGFSTGNLSYQLGGSSVSDTNAAAQLTISHDEGVSGTIQFTKTFSADAVAAGSTIDLEFYIALTGDFTASGLSFTDDLDAMLSGAVATGLPASDICGSGSSISGTSSLTFSGGNLASGSSCRFSVTVQVPGGASGGTYNNTTSTLAATRSDKGAVTVAAATDSFDVSASGGTLPTATISGATTDLGVGVSRSLTVRFSEAIDQIEIADFSITNATVSALTGSGPEWTLTLSPNATGAVSVQLQASVAQDAQGDLNQASNTFTFTAVTPAPEINITGNSVTILSGDTLPVATDHTIFPSTDVSGGTSTRTFTIQNLGTGPLTVSGVSITGAHSSDFSVTTAPAGTVAPGGSTRFTVTFDPSATGLRNATVVVANNDADESSYGFAVEGTGSASPEIAVADSTGATNIPHQDASPSVAKGSDFGSVVTDGGVASSTFRISNPGSATLTLGSNAVSLTGSSDFTVTAQPATSVAASGSTTFSIQFDPSSAGVATATVSIANNDSDEAPFTFQLTGRGTDTSPPSGHSVAFGSALYGPPTYTSASFTIDDPEVRSSYSWSISSSGGGTPVTGSGTIPTPGAGQPTELQITGVNLTGLNQGTLTVSVVLTDENGNAATAVTGTTTLDLEGPDVTISTGSPDPVSGAFTATFTFTEDVTGFVVGDISVGNGAASAFSATSGSVYTATITPAADGPVTIDVPLDAADDAAGNGSNAATQFTIENDETAPTLTISTVSADPVSGAFTAAFIFSEDVTGFTLGDISVGNGAASGFAGSGSVYSATITPASDGTVTVDVAAGVAQDDAGNNNTAATQFSIENDETVPTVAITSSASDPVSGAFSVTITFSEDVTGFSVGDISVGNGAASAFSATSATVYTATITPAADGAVTVDVAAGVAQDDAGNNNTAATQFTIESDASQPSVTISSGSPDPVSGAFAVTFTFSEDVTGFALADITVGNGSASGFAGSGSSYSATITPAADGAVTVDVAAGVAQDDAGNVNTAATQFSIENDETAPTVAITTTDTEPVSGAFSVTFTFSEDVTGFAVGDITTGNATASDLTGSGSVYTANITPAATGTVTVDVAAGVAQDGAGNGNTAATQFTLESDLTPPTLAISGPSAIQMGAFTVTFTFSEDVTGFALADITVGNGSASGFAGSGSSYSATITPAADGAVTVDVAAGVAQDNAGNDNTAATQFSVDADLTAPGVTIATGSSDPVSGAFAVTFTFTEDVTGFAVGDITVGNGAASGFAGSGGSYTATITPAADGSVTVDVAAGVAQDAAGNANTAATQFSIENDQTAPTVAISGPSAVQIGAFTVSFTFSEDVTGFTLADIAVGNGAASDLAGSGAAYTATITPAASGGVTVDIAAGAAQDNAANDNTAATQFAVNADLSVPTLNGLVVSDADLRVDDAGGSFTVTATFSEAMDPAQTPSFAFETDLSATLSLDSGAFSSGDTVYTATYTIADGGQVASDVDITLSGAADAAGNPIADTTVADLFSVEMRRGSISVAVGITGAVDGTFDFTGDLGDFSVITANQAGSQDFTDLAEGDYAFTAAEADGFTLDAISCSGGTTVTDASTGAVTVTLGPTDTVMCSFTQVAEPDVDETAIPEVTIELPTLSDDPTSETTSFSLENVGGEAFYFNASTDQVWLVIDPTSGSIPATGSLEFTVSFTAAVLDLDPGTYTATITITEVDPPSQRGGGRKANTLETINIPVTVTLEPRLGDLTLVVNTTMPEEGEGQFSYTSSLAGFDGVTLQTVGGTARASIADVLRGTYTITQQDVEGWDLASITCTGDTDGGNAIDLANGVVTIDLDPEEDMVCTFTNRRNEEFIRAITMSAIRNFMATRADLILTNSPRLAGRMRGNRTNATPNRFVADYADGRFRAQMSTSLSALRQAAEESQPQQPGAERFSLQGRTGLSSLDVWMQASLSSVSDNRAGLGSEADFAVYHIGTDVMLNETTLVGVMLQYDLTEMVTGDWNSAVEGDGWMVGPYMVARFGENTYFDVRALWGRSENTINPIGTYTDEFETDRWMVEMNLAGDILMGAWRVTPGIGLAYFTEEQQAYRDSLDFLIPSQRVTIGRLSMGPEIAYRIENADGSYFEPYINLSALYDYDDADVFNAAGQLQTLGHLRGDARLGLTAELANGGRITGEITLIGLGEGEFEANNAMLRIRLPLSME